MHRDLLVVVGLVLSASALPASADAQTTGGGPLIGYNDRVQSNGDSDPVLLWLADDPVGLRLLCATPCHLTLPAGPHRFALSAGSGTPVVAAEELVLSGPTVVEGTYGSHRRTRIAGGVIMGVGILAGIILWLVGISMNLREVSDSDRRTRDSAVLASAGSIAFGLGLAVGIGLMSTRDGVSVRLAPR